MVYKRLRGCGVLSGILLLLTTSLWGGIIKDDFLINDDSLSGSMQEWHSSALLAGGNFVIVMTDQRETYQIYGQIYDQNGNPIGGNFQVSEAYSILNRYPDVAPLADGRFVVTWNRHTFGEDWYVTARIFNSDALPAGDDFDVPENSSGHENFPSVSASPDRILFTWQNGLDLNIYGRVFDTDGNALTGDFLISETSGEHMCPVSAYGGSGFFLVTFISSLADSEYVLMARKISPDGTPIGNSFILGNINTGDPKPHTHDITSFSGGFLITWYDTREGGDIYLTKLDENGTPVGDEIRVTEISGTCLYNAVAASDSFFFVSYWDMREDSSRTLAGEIKGDIWARIIRADGTPLTDEFRVNSDPPGAQQVFTDVAGSGNRFLVSFIDRRNLNKDVYARFYELSEPLGPEFPVADDSGSAKQIFPACDANVNDEFAVAFADDRNGTDPDVFVTFLSPLGEFLTPNINVVQADTWNTLQSHPDVALSATGRSVVVWLDYRNNFPIVMGQILDENHELLGSNFIVSDGNTAYSVYRPTVGIRDDGSFAVAWIDNRAEGGNRHRVYIRLFDAGGTPLGPSFRASDATGDFSEEAPTLSMNGEGYFVVSWKEKRDAQVTPYVRLFDPSGSPLTSSIMVAPPQDALLDLSSGIDSLENFAVGWIWNQHRIMGKVFDSSGNVIAGPFEVSGSDTLSNQNLSVSMSASGRIAFLWTSFGADPQGEVWTQYFDLEGNPLGNNSLINDNGQGQYQVSREFSCAASPNEVIFVWEDMRRQGKGTDVFAQINDWQGQQLVSERDVLGHEKNRLFLYPNPTRGNFVLQYSVPSGGIRAVSLFDASGRKIGDLYKPGSGDQLPRSYYIGDLPQGVYFVVVKTDKESQKARIELLK